MRRQFRRPPGGRARRGSATETGRRRRRHASRFALPAPPEYSGGLLGRPPDGPGDLRIPAGAQVMPMSWKLPSLLLVLAPLWAQEKPRDITIEKEAAAEKQPEAPAAVTIPHSYAVVAGIATYAALPAKSQLHFSERDAEAIYSILISPEGGNFHAEHVL